MKLFHVSIASVLSTLVKLGSLLLINKLMALYLLPVDYGKFGQYQSLFQLIVTLSFFGASSGVVKQIAEANGNTLKEVSVVRVMLQIFYISSFFILLVLFFRFDYFFWFFDNSELKNNFHWLKILTLLSIVFSGLATISAAICSGKFLYKVNYKSNVIACLIAAVMAFPLISIFKFSGAIIIFLIYSVSPIFFTYKEAKIFKAKFKIKEFMTPNIKIMRSLFLFSGAALVSASALPLFQIYIRNQLYLQKLDISVGLWQAVLRISDLGVLFPSSILAAYLLPKVSSINELALIKNELKKVLMYLLPSYAFGIIIFICFKESLIVLIFSGNYLEVSNFISMQLIGDIFRLPIMSIAIVLLAKGMISRFVIVESLSPLLQLFFLNIDHSPLSLASLTQNYAFSMAISLFLIGVFFQANEMKKTS
jgi:PST family polysaccharide transporter